MKKYFYIFFVFFFSFSVFSGNFTLPWEGDPGGWADFGVYDVPVKITGISIPREASLYYSTPPNGYVGAIFSGTVYNVPAGQGFWLTGFYDDVEVIRVEAESGGSGDVNVTVQAAGVGNTNPPVGVYVVSSGQNFTVSAVNVLTWVLSSNIVTFSIAPDLSSVTFVVPSSDCVVTCVFNEGSGGSGGDGDSDDDVPAIEALSDLIGGKIDQTNQKLDTIIDILNNLQIPPEKDLEIQASGSGVSKNLDVPELDEFTFLDDVEPLELNLFSRLPDAWDVSSWLGLFWGHSYASVAPVLVLPFSSFGVAGWDDITLDFGPSFDWFRLFCRTFFLLFVVVWGIIAVIRITKSFEF
jgi:hypothetical protein